MGRDAKIYAAMISNLSTQSGFYNDGAEMIALAIWKDGRQKVLGRCAKDSATFDSWRTQMCGVIRRLQVDSRPKIH